MSDALWPDFVGPTTLEAAHERAKTIPEEALQSGVEMSLDSRTSADGLLASIESEASNFLGFAGVVAGLVGGGLILSAKLMHDAVEASEAYGWALTAAILFLAATVAVIVGAMFAHSSLQVGGKHISRHPDPDQGFQAELGLASARRNAIAKNFFAAATNMTLAQSKANKVGQAQFWLAWGIVIGAVALLPAIVGIVA